MQISNIRISVANSCFVLGHTFTMNSHDVPKNAPVVYSVKEFKKKKKRGGGRVYGEVGKRKRQ